jgi:hypothetical protein
MNNRISLERDEVDRMVMLSLDFDRLQTQVVPDLQQRVYELKNALIALCAAAGQHTDLKLAVARAKEVLNAPEVSLSTSDTVKQL